jgi:hypothetical protein
MKPKTIVVLSCWCASAALTSAPLAHAADPHVYTQTCPNGDKIAVDMNKKTLSVSRGGKTWRATYDDGYAMTWSTKNPPLPDGVQALPTGGTIGTDGAFFGDGDMDNDTVCPRDK